MNQNIGRIIHESRQLLKVATPEQKMRLLKLLKESISAVSQQKNVNSIELPKNTDYLEEK